MYITNDPSVALIAEKYGVDRIWIDLEKIGKEERQKGRDSVKSYHTIEDITHIKPLLTKSELLVRINALYKNSKEEIDAVIAAGADIIMLPMWKTVKDVKTFLTLVAGRTKTTLLLETREAEECLDEVLALGGFDEIHIGLNDLHISYGLTFMFELLTNGTIERICKKIENFKIPYGFGGIAKIGCGTISAEKIIFEHYRLHSTRVILSRTFCDYTKTKSMEEIEYIFSENIHKLRDFENYVQKADKSILNNNKNILIKDINNVVKAIRKEQENCNKANG